MNAPFPLSSSPQSRTCFQKIVDIEPGRGEMIKGTDVFFCALILKRSTVALPPFFKWRAAGIIAARCWIENFRAARRKPALLRRFQRGDKRRGVTVTQRVLGPFHSHGARKMKHHAEKGTRSIFSLRSSEGSLHGCGAHCAYVKCCFPCTI